MFDSRHIHIAIASDKNYAKFVKVAINSFFNSNPAFKHATFHLLATDIDEFTINDIRQTIPTDKGELEVYDLSNISSKLTMPVPDTIAISAYNRLFLSDIISDDIDRVLYIDCDVVFNGDITDFWNTDLSNMYISGVLDTLPDIQAKISIGLKPDAPYINSGVLLISLTEWRKDNLTQQFLKFLTDHEGKVYHHDQGIINAVCTGKVKISSPIYNATTCYFSHPYKLVERTNTPFYSEEEYIKARKEPRIIHFTEGFLNRPWKENCSHPFKNVFLNYYNNMGYTLAPDNRSLAVKLLSWTFLNTHPHIYNIVSRSISALKRVFP